MTSLDHKKIGIMYIIFAGIMLTRALIEAVLMRTQQAIAINNHGHCRTRAFRRTLLDPWDHHGLLRGDAAPYWH